MTIYGQAHFRHIQPDYHEETDISGLFKYNYVLHNSLRLGEVDSRLQNYADE